jgi:hypothetical protein
MFSPDGLISETVDTLGKLQLVLYTEELQPGIDLLNKRTGQSLAVGRERVSTATLAIPQTHLDRAREMLDPEYEMLRQMKA